MPGGPTALCRSYYRLQAAALGRPPGRRAVLRRLPAGHGAGRLPHLHGGVYLPVPAEPAHLHAHLAGPRVVSVRLGASVLIKKPPPLGEVFLSLVAGVCQHSVDDLCHIHTGQRLGGIKPAAAGGQDAPVHGKGHSSLGVTGHAAAITVAVQAVDGAVIRAPTHCPHGALHHTDGVLTGQGAVGVIQPAANPADDPPGV